MSTITKEGIRKRICEKKENKQLVITPLLDPNQIGDASVDLRLGFEFIVFNLPSIGCIDPSKNDEIEREIHKYQTRVRVNRGGRFVLHPKQFVLGSTLEYIVLPVDLHGEVGGRSTWGRTGLVIATATTVAPGFHGCITLELANEGMLPLILRPGDSVAQLVLHTASPPASPYAGSYKYQTGPMFPHFKKPKDAQFWQESNEGDQGSAVG